MLPVDPMASKQLVRVTQLSTPNFQACSEASVVALLLEASEISEISEVSGVSHCPVALEQVLALKLGVVPLEQVSVVVLDQVLVLETPKRTKAVYQLPV